MGEYAYFPLAIFFREMKKESDDNQYLTHSIRRRNALSGFGYETLSYRRESDNGRWSEGQINVGIVRDSRRS